jgi:hypothetical protein
MAEAERVAPAQKRQGQKVVTELKVSGHLMTLDAGLFCIVQSPSAGVDPVAGLPGVRLSLPPGAGSRPEAVSIATFRDDGWLTGTGDAALVRVVGGPAQILVTVYQAPAAQEGAPNLQVLRLLDGQAAAAAAPRPVPVRAANPAAVAPAAAPAGAPTPMDVLAHVQERGDVGVRFGEWVGERGSKRWIEGFAVAPLPGLSPHDLEYQAVLGRGWLSPWVEGGQFCGSRGMALPILGLRVRLRGAAAEQYELSYAATFVDGSEVGSVAAGGPCEAESLAPIEAFQILLKQRGAVEQESEGQAAPEARVVAAKAAAPKPATRTAPVAKSAARKPARKPAGR